MKYLERGDKEKVLKLSLYLTLYRYIEKVLPLALLGGRGRTFSPWA